jgi:type VI secretion system secreted protein Hcp
MPAYMELEGIEGEVQESNHENWIDVESMNAPIYRSIAEGTLGANRNRGTTSLGDVSITRKLDKSSVKIQEACAAGTYFPEVKVHFATSIQGEERVYLEYVMKHCIITGYNFTGVGEGDPVPTEDITLNFTEVEWTYTILNPETGDVDGNVPGSYVPAVQ